MFLELSSLIQMCVWLGMPHTIYNEVKMHFFPFFKNNTKRSYWWPLLLSSEVSQIFSTWKYLIFWRKYWILLILFLYLCIHSTLVKAHMSQSINFKATNIVNSKHTHTNVIIICSTIKCSKIHLPSSGFRIEISLTPTI